MTRHGRLGPTLPLTLITVLLTGLALVAPEIARAAAGADWTVQTGPSTNRWKSVAYGGPAGSEVFVAVAGSGAADRVMTSPDGVTWTPRAAAADHAWASVTYGEGLFVAVGSSGSNTDRIMTSPDGITWTSRTTPDVNLSWASVAYGDGTFVVISNQNQADNVLTSPDGLTWTRQTGTPLYGWRAVTYGAGLFVAVRSSSDQADQVMTSPDGATWTTRNAITRWWDGVYYGGPSGSEQFIAVSSGGEDQGVMTSPNGVDWTVRDTPGLASESAEWTSVVYGDGQYVAVADSGSSCSQQVPNCAMTSADGVTWTAHQTPQFRRWYSVTYAHGRFVSVADTAELDNIMTSGTFDPNPTPSPTPDPSVTPTPTPTATPQPTPTPTPAPTRREPTSLRVAALGTTHRITAGNTTTLTRWSRSNGEVTQLRATCLLNGRVLHGGAARRVCGLTVAGPQPTGTQAVSTERERTRVTTSPSCTRKVAVNVRIAARAPGHSRTVWTRTWRTPTRPSISCALPGTG